MAQLAIKGHPTRGKEVIGILEMLGGKNKEGHHGNIPNIAYYISHHNTILCNCISNIQNCVDYTLEEFLKKFPHKVGDKVTFNDNPNDLYTINSMAWDADLDRVVYKIEEIDVIMDGHSDTGFWYAGELERYLEQKVETMEDKRTLKQIDLTREDTKAEEIEVILGDYEFVLKDGKTYFVKKKPQYPKTYEECCKIMGIEYPVIGGKPDGLGASTYKITAIRPLIYLLICRDAYWKIAGWDSKVKGGVFYMNTLPSYLRDLFPMPIEEMRDTFFENFKDLIEEAKELLYL